ncbi:MAG TPA: hypothetical protein GX697_06790, partial [Firmicutes bacterium]|nr:hypothetical protein [Bacillota bacterium]
MAVPLAFQRKSYFPLQGASRRYQYSLKTATILAAANRRRLRREGKLSM